MKEFFFFFFLEDGGGRDCVNSLENEKWSELLMKIGRKGQVIRLKEKGTTFNVSHVIYS